MTKDGSGRARNDECRTVAWHFVVLWVQEKREKQRNGEISIGWRSDLIANSLSHSASRPMRHRTHVNRDLLIVLPNPSLSPLSSGLVDALSIARLFPGNHFSQTLPTAP